MSPLSFSLIFLPLPVLSLSLCFSHGVVLWIHARLCHCAREAVAAQRYAEGCLTVAVSTETTSGQTKIQIQSCTTLSKPISWPQETHTDLHPLQNPISFLFTMWWRRGHKSPHTHTHTEKSDTVLCCDVLGQSHVRSATAQCDLPCSKNLFSPVTLHLSLCAPQRFY